MSGRRLVVQPAQRSVTRFHLELRRMVRAAHAHGVGAACEVAAPVGRLEHVGRRPLDRLQSPVFDVASLGMALLNPRVYGCADR
jgi:hypothetical protein